MADTSSDSESSDYSLQEVFTEDSPIKTTVTTTTTTTATTTKDFIEAAAAVQLFLDAELIPISQNNFFQTTLQHTLRTFQDGDTVDNADGSILFVLQGEIMVNERGQVPRSITVGDVFGHLSILMQRKSNHVRSLTASRNHTKCGFLSCEALQRVPLLPALLLIRETRWLKDLNYASRTFIGAHFKPMVFAMNEHLIVQNVIGKGLYIIVRGTCSVLQTSESSDAMIQLTKLYPGHFFGAMSLMSTTHLTNAHVVANNETVETVFFSRECASVLLTQEKSFEQTLNNEILRKSSLNTKRKQSKALSSSEATSLGSLLSVGNVDAGKEDNTSDHFVTRSDSMLRMQKFNTTRTEKHHIRHSYSVNRSKTIVPGDDSGSSNKKINSINGFRVLHTLGKRVLDCFRVLHTFSYHTSKSSLLGQGSYGKVKLVEDDVTGLKYAMKIIKRPQVLSNYHTLKHNRPAKGYHPGNQLSTIYFLLAHNAEK